MHNVYEQFKQLLSDPPLQVGTVSEIGTGVVTVSCRVVAPSRPGAAQAWERAFLCAMAYWKPLHPI